MSFARLRPLFGTPVDDKAVQAVLARAGTVFVPKIARGELLVARDAGFDVLLARPDRKRGTPLCVFSITLYREGIATPGAPPRSRADYIHQQFTDPPFGLAFGPRRELLAKMPRPRETWLWGTGAVELRAPFVSYDEWTIDELTVQVHYAGTVRAPAAAADARVEHIDITATST